MPAPPSPPLAPPGGPPWTGPRQRPAGLLRIEMGNQVASAGSFIAANIYNISWSNGLEVQLDIGLIPLDHIARATQSGKGVVKPNFSHHVFMSVGGFAQLYHAVNGAAEALRAQGVPIDDMMPVQIEKTTGKN